MARHQPFQIIGYHSCDKDIGLKILNGQTELIPSNNDWDWLGGGVYFWEQDPKHALDYAIDVANGDQHNSGKIVTPFIIGAIIELGNCLNLVESQSLSIIKEAHIGLVKLYGELGKKLPTNRDAIRKLDCSVIRYIHQSRKEAGEQMYDTIRSAFDEGEKVYEGASFTSRHHIQVCVINETLIRGYFLPRPLEEFNPYFNKKFIKTTQNKP
ncbi:MAG: hypothetical protein WDO19_29485 [Bacteroidota bacterium]